MSLVVVRVLGLVTVQDLGRPGRMHEAVPPGGALVPELVVAANRAVGNPDGAPALEIFGRLVVRAEVAVATSAASLRAADELVIASEPRRVAYLAVRGGIDAPLVLGGRGALLGAGLGAPLRAGDRIAPAGDRANAEAAGDRVVREAAVDRVRVDANADFATYDAAAGDRIRVIAGPDAAAFAPDALARLVSAPYRLLAASDRVGTRLAGPALPRVAGYAETSRPMVRGALEVPRDGMPIVLGPDHPTTGGYPILAVIAHADLGRFFAIRLGGEVRFDTRSPR